MLIIAAQVVQHIIAAQRHITMCTDAQLPCTQWLYIDHGQHVLAIRCQVSMQLRVN